MPDVEWLPQWPNIADATAAQTRLAEQLGTDPALATPQYVTQVAAQLADAGLAILVIDAHAPATSEAQFEQRLAECAKAAELLGIPSVLAIPLDRLPDALKALEPHDRRGRLRRRVRHVVTERARSAAFADLMQHGFGTGGKPDVEAATLTGQLMDASHRSVRDDFEATAPQTDLAVATAHGAGAYGARMLGSGFGGIVFALVPADEVDSIAGAVVHGFASVGLTPPAFYRA